MLDMALVKEVMDRFEEREDIKVVTLGDILRTEVNIKGIADLIALMHELSNNIMLAQLYLQELRVESNRTVIRAYIRAQDKLRSQVERRRNALTEHLIVSDRGLPAIMRELEQLDIETVDPLKGDEDELPF